MHNFTTLLYNRSSTCSLHQSIITQKLYLLSLPLQGAITAFRKYGMKDANLKDKFILQMLISVYFEQQKSAAMYYDTQNRNGIFVFQCTKTQDAVITVTREAHILYSRNPCENHQYLGSTYSL